MLTHSPPLLLLLCAHRTPSLWPHYHILLAIVVVRHDPVLFHCWQPPWSGSPIVYTTLASCCLLTSCITVVAYQRYVLSSLQPIVNPQPSSLIVSHRRKLPPEKKMGATVDRVKGLIEFNYHRLTLTVNRLINDN